MDCQVMPSFSRFYVICVHKYGTTLLFIQQQAAALNILTPCITFDQPLWIKSVEIVVSKSMNVVCKLGGFHLQNARQCF